MRGGEGRGEREKGERERGERGEGRGERGERRGSLWYRIPEVRGMTVRGEVTLGGGCYVWILKESGHGWEQKIGGLGAHLADSY